MKVSSDVARKHEGHEDELFVPFASFLPAVSQKLNVTLNRANLGDTIDVGFSQVAPLVA